MGLFHPDDDLPTSRRLVGAPKTDATIPGEFLDTVVPESWRKYDAQAAYDPEAIPLQNVPNPCEGDDDLPPASSAMVLVYGISAVVSLWALAFLLGWLT